MSYPRTCCKLGSLIIVAVLAAAGCGNPHPGAVATPPPVVLVATPIKGKDGQLPKVRDYQVFTARTQALESVDIIPRVSGYLTKICFKDGDLVKKDQVLFEIDDRPYKANLDAAKADLEVKQAAVVKTKALYDIGLAVQKQDKSAISQQELESRKGTWEEAKGGVDQAKAALEKAQLYYDWCRVQSPLDGQANRHFIDAGNMITQDKSTLTNIVSTQHLWAYFDVDENTINRYMAMVKKGEVDPARKVRIPLQMAIGSSNDYSMEGYLDFVSNQLDPNTASARVRGYFPNADGKLAGMFGRVRLPIGPAHEALLVVDEAIGTNQSNRFIYVVNDKNEVEYRAVDVGQLHDGFREIKRFRTVLEPTAGGQDVEKQVEVLKPTERVIVEGLMRVRPGVKVEPRLVDMATLLEQTAAAAPTDKK
jgi:RND family efflux transporter MFP subunit